MALGSVPIHTYRKMHYALCLEYMRNERKMQACAVLLSISRTEVVMGGSSPPAPSRPALEETLIFPAPVFVCFNQCGLLYDEERQKQTILTYTQVYIIFTMRMVKLKYSLGLHAQKEKMSVAALHIVILSCVAVAYDGCNSCMEPPHIS